ncbi:hypothetical protein CY35_03G093500 [Sphagnum magellanicum]|nr:hypothetical protein CY35_03G093500 [Sphagnum magellanicum]
MIFKTKQYSESLLHFPSHPPSPLSPPALRPQSTIMTRFLKPTLLPAGANFGDSLSISISVSLQLQQRKSDAQNEDKCSLALHTAHCARREGGRQGGEGGEQGEDSNGGNRSGRSVGIGARSGNRSVVSTMAIRSV